MLRYIALYIILRLFILIITDGLRTMFARDIFISSDLLVIVSLLISDIYERFITMLWYFYHLTVR